MKSAKQEIQEVLDTLPDDVPFEEIVRNLQFHARMLHSRAQALRGELASNEEVMGDLRRWRQSAGR